MLLHCASEFWTILLKLDSTDRMGRTYITYHITKKCNFFRYLPLAEWICMGSFFVSLLDACLMNMHLIWSHRSGVCLEEYRHSGIFFSWKTQAIFIYTSFNVWQLHNHNFPTAPMHFVGGIAFSFFYWHLAMPTFLDLITQMILTSALSKVADF